LEVVRRQRQWGTFDTLGGGPRTPKKNKKKKNPQKKPGGNRVFPPPPNLKNPKGKKGKKKSKLWTQGGRFHRKMGVPKQTKHQRGGKKVLFPKKKRPNLVGKKTLKKNPKVKNFLGGKKKKKEKTKSGGGGQKGEPTKTAPPPKNTKKKKKKTEFPKKPPKPNVPHPRFNLNSPKKRPSKGWVLFWSNFVWWLGGGEKQTPQIVPNNPTVVSIDAKENGTRWFGGETFFGKFSTPLNKPTPTPHPPPPPPGGYKQGRGSGPPPPPTPNLAMGFFGPTHNKKNSKQTKKNKPR